MVFTDEDRIFIKNLHWLKGSGAERLLSEFTDKGWKLEGVKALLSCRSRQRERLSASMRSICSSVCLSVAKIQKNAIFSKNLAI